MNTVLSVYAKKAYKEFILPNVNNANHTIALDAHVFGMLTDRVLSLDVIENKWRVLKDNQYSLKIENYEVDSISLSGDTSFLVVFKDNTVVQVISREINGDLVSTQKLEMAADSISVGSRNGCDIVFSSSKYISQNHAIIFRTRDGWCIEDHSRNGLFLNSVRVNVSGKLNFGDCINLVDARLVFLNGCIAINSREDFSVNAKVLKPYMADFSNQTPIEVVKGKLAFNRAPRIIEHLSADPVEIEAPPAPKPEETRSMFATIGPSFTMAIPMLLGCLLMVANTSVAGGTFMYTGLVTAVTSGMLGAIWGVYNYRNNKKKLIAEEKHRFDAYSDYLLQSADRIKNIYEHNTEILNNLYPSAQECSEMNHSTPKLWNRNITHKDFLEHRIGIGNTDFQVDIQIPKEKFSLIDDSLSKKPKMIKDTYSVLHNVPKCIDLKSNRIIGIVGGDEKTGAYDIMRSLVVQIAANNCYIDVKMVFFAGEGDAGREMSFAKWLPHCWSEERKMRFLAVSKDEISDVCYELTKVFRLRDEKRATDYSGNTLQIPHYVVFVDNINSLEGEPITRYLLDDSEKNCGWTTVLLAENYEQLPNSCKCIAYNDSHYTGVYSNENLSSIGKNVLCDYVSLQDAENFARRLSNIHVAEISKGGEIPNTLTFLEMYGAKTIEQLEVIDNWKKNRTYDSLKALIGYRAGGIGCYLDIHEKYHGPHGLVAGTTGSGKSETLQTYILSLAVGYSPDDIGFLIIDFKGGGMANLFTNLPHLIGSISNLSGNQVRRAMISIKSENLRRQRVFSEHGVNNINAYTRLLKSNEAAIPMPHLFIIIDEFAELKREEPEFMSELISVAQVGRSLGVHLILATQKPGGTVDDNIRSNSRFKLCLRVQDRQDSNEMIGRPDAAYISQAGRCFLQVGNDEIFENFQSGWSGASYDPGSAEHSGIVKLLDSTGKAVMTGNKVAVERKESLKKEWLSDILIYIKSEEEKCGDRLNVTVSDSIKKQNYIKALCLTFENNNVAFNTSKRGLNALENLLSICAHIGCDDIDAIIQCGRDLKSELPEPVEKSQLEAVIEYLKYVAEQNGYSQKTKLWLPVLGEKIYLSEISKDCVSGITIDNTDIFGKWDLIAPVGVCDDPANQAQPVAYVDFGNNGHFALCGNVTSGKSTFLQTLLWSLITRYSPEHLNIYAIDYSNHMLQPFESAPHVGDVVYESDTDKMDKLFYILSQMLLERKKNIRGGNYEQYVKTNGLKYPAVVVAIDNYASLREKTNDKYESILWEISRDGSGFGIFLAISAGGFGSAGLQTKIADNISNIFALNMGDKMKYIDILRTTHLEIMPEVNVKGRGLANKDGAVLEFQTALSLEADDDYARSEKLKALCEIASASYKGRCAAKIPEIPVNPTWKTICEEEGFVQALSNPDILPFAYEERTAAIFGMNLADSFCYLIGGKSHSGRTDTLKVMAVSAKKKAAKVCIIDSAAEELKRFSEKWADEYMVTPVDILNFGNRLSPIFKERNVLKNEMLNNGSEESEIYEAMREKQPMFIFIADFLEFLKTIYTDNENTGLMYKFFETLFEKGRLHNIYFIIDVNYDDINLLMSRRAYSLVSGYKTGVSLRGNLNLQKIFDTSSMSYSNLNKTYPSGMAIAFDSDGHRKIIIPLSKGV